MLLLTCTCTCTFSVSVSAQDSLLDRISELVTSIETTQSTLELQLDNERNRSAAGGYQRGLTQHLASARAKDGETSWVAMARRAGQHMLAHTRHLP